MTIGTEDWMMTSMVAGLPGDESPAGDRGIADADQRVFDVLISEWSTCAAAAIGAADLAEWESALGHLRAEQAALLDAGKWVGGAGDLLSVLRLGRRELAHSAIMAWLLDPRGRHGLGVKCLEAVIQRTYPELLPAQLRDVRVECEVVRWETRADIVVFGKELTLVIENKVDAGEMPDQCDRLFDRFGWEPGAAFIFLTPTGRPPTTATGVAAGRFRALSYKSWTAALEGCVNGARASTSVALQSVANYLETLRREFE